MGLVITKRSPQQNLYLNEAMFCLRGLHVASHKHGASSYIAAMFYASREGLDMTITINTEDQKRQFARESMEWLDSIPDDRHEWCDALIAGAIDECRGDLLRALDMAKAQYIETPEPPDEPYPTADNYTAPSTIPQRFAGYVPYPGPVQPLPDSDPNEVPFKADRKNEQVDNG